VGTLIVIWLFMAAVKHLVVNGYEDMAFARRGRVSPRRQEVIEKARSRAAQPARYGLRGYLQDLWHDSWEGAREDRVRKRSGLPVLADGLRWASDDDYPDPWRHAQPVQPARPRRAEAVEDVTPKTVPQPPRQPAPTPAAPTTTPAPKPAPTPTTPPAPRQPSPTPTTAGGNVAIEATNFESAVAAQQQTIKMLEVLLTLTQDAQTAIQAANGCVESLDGRRSTLNEDVRSLSEQLQAKRLDGASVAGAEQVLLALAPTAIQRVHEAMETGLNGVANIHAAIEEALAAAGASLASMQGTYADAADTVASTGVDATFLAPDGVSRVASGTSTGAGFPTAANGRAWGAMRGDGTFRTHLDHDAGSVYVNLPPA
jgi:hypothetical protein